MIKFVALGIVGLILQGCSFLVDLAFFNNSGESIEICNLNMERESCRTIKPNELVKVLLVGDKPANSWHFSIARAGHIGIYVFSFGPYPEHASDLYCEGIFQKRCDIPVQFERNGLLYWGGKSEGLPIVEFPKQPKGFPVEPSV